MDVPFVDKGSPDIRVADLQGYILATGLLFPSQEVRVKIPFESLSHWRKFL